MQLRAQAQEGEEKVTVTAPEEGQKGETPAPAQNVGPAPAPAEGQKAETPAPAPAAKEKAEALEKIVVTATRTERNPDDVPASITVITKEDIKKQNIQTVDEAVAQVVGAFDFRQVGWQDTQPSVNLRGFPADNQKRTLILLDGQNVATGYFNGVLWNMIPVQNIERIEVIRGPFSALYGGTAMGGVINIITTTPKKLEMLGQTSFGTYNSWNSYVGAGDRFWDKVSIQAGFNYRNTTGYPANPVTMPSMPFAAAPTVVGWRPTIINNKAEWTSWPGTTYIIGDSGNLFSNDYNINGKITCDIAEGHKWTFSTLCSYFNYGYNNYHDYLINPINGANVTDGIVGLAGRNESFFLMQNLFLQGFGRTRTQVYNLTTDDSLTDTTKLKCHFGLVNQPENWYILPSYFNPQTTYSGGPGQVTTTPSKEWVAEVQVERPIGQKQQLVAGLSYNTGWASTYTNNLYDWRALDTYGGEASMSAGRDRNVGVFLQDEIAWHPKFSTVAGLRVDWWQTYGGSFLEATGSPTTYLPSRAYAQCSPKLAFLYRPWEWMTWRTSVGSAFRPPNIYELYTTWSYPGLIWEGNPHLKPETTISWEIGTTLKPFKGTEFTTTYFENYVHDLIMASVTSSTPVQEIYTQENVKRATIRGFEIELKQKLWSWLEVNGNTTLVDGRIREDPYDWFAVGKKITMSPRQQFNFGVTATYWKFKAYLSGRYVSKIMSTAENSDTINNVPGSYDPFFLLNSKITFSPWEYMDLSVAWDNMLNRQYYEYYRTPGRMWWTQLTLKY
jgi:iron complex outermembrane receptor protein